MVFSQKIVPCLWFDDQAEAAAQFYVDIFENSRIVNITRYGSAGTEIHGRPPGSVMVVEFEIEGQSFTGLNGGPLFKFSEAISFQIICESQQEIDYYWGKLTEGGDVKAQQCGWLKDQFGASWQVVPTGMHEMLAEPESPGARRAMEALLKMKRIDLAELKRAYAG